MPGNGMWKAFERQIATWFKTVRNPLSGRNNYTDSGEQRPGDVILDSKMKTLIECKTRNKYHKTGIYSRALETVLETKKLKLKHWFHFERKNGSKKIYVLATNEKWMEKICGFIRQELDKEIED